ncbi:MAG: protein-methionine-sulfoxide reductase catalytic subunit MsrP [Rhodospirillales bacterium]|nr:protein-methionine-sulfoxide reductase catalytic subunit MsrP [Rhodospirillales bacterium]
MLIKRTIGWELPERLATPEATFLNRRALVAAMGLAPVAAMAAVAPAAAQGAEPSARIYPVSRNPAHALDGITPETLATTYNNCYEFGSHKTISSDARERLKIRPWTVRIDGMVEKPIELGIDDLLARMPLEERVYRHRCVETWAMVVPYSGFPLKALVELAKPASGATYLVMKTLANPSMFPGQREFYYPWPYTEGLTMAEATHDLSFIATGLYGKPIPAQNGAPLRLATPWKYGFKHVKSIVSFTFSDKRPVSFWEKLIPTEYGFWANVNPDVPHPRWSQATEKMLGSEERVPTRLYNGYGEFVASLYKDLPRDEKPFM